MEFDQLREYREGDSLRKIDWKASQHLGKLISRDYQDERDQQAHDCRGPTSGPHDERLLVDGTRATARGRPDRHASTSRRVGSNFRFGVFHNYGTRRYGKTKQVTRMTEQARAGRNSFRAAGT
jgi:hypothetical protein